MINEKAAKIQELIDKGVSPERAEGYINADDKMAYLEEQVVGMGATPADLDKIRRIMTAFDEMLLSSNDSPTTAMGMETDSGFDIVRTFVQETVVKNADLNGGPDMTNEEVLIFGFMLGLATGMRVDREDQ